MYAVTLSPEFQIVIPLPVRRSMGLRAGQTMQVVEYEGRIELIPEGFIAASAPPLTLWRRGASGKTGRIGPFAVLSRRAE